MHLFDQVKLGVSDRERKGLTNNQPCVQLGARVALADRRFVLDDHVGSVTKALLFEQAELLADTLAHVRLPTETFWLEWRDYDLEGGKAFPDPRVGMLVEAAEGARSGEFTLVWERRHAAPEVTPTRFFFDLDMPMSPARGWFMAKHENEALDRVCQHIRIECTGSTGRKNGNAWTDQTVAQAAWMAGPFMFAFSMLLLRSGEVTEHDCSRERLNAARAARGAPALLDHTELRLTKPQVAGTRGSSSFNSAGVRLHHVRGHLVRRGAAVFWRRAHLRGDAAVVGSGEPRFTRVRL